MFSPVALDLIVHRIVLMPMCVDGCISSERLFSRRQGLALFGYPESTGWIDSRLGVLVPPPLRGSIDEESRFGFPGDLDVLSVLGTFDLGQKIAAIELGRISAQDNYVGSKCENRLHPRPVVGRDFIIPHHAEPRRCLP
jgi:hypothetical protein